MATSELRIKVRTDGADQASKKLGGVSSAATSLAKSVAAAGAAYFGANAIISGMQKSNPLSDQAGLPNT